MRKQIPVEESFQRWREDPAYTEAYAALEPEFAVAAALIEARNLADRPSTASRKRPARA